MSTHKNDRAGEDIKREITAIIRELKDPRIEGKFLTVVRADLASDLSYGKIYISAMEGLETAKEAVKCLTRAEGLIKKELGARLHLRKAPELKFIADDSVQKGIELWSNYEKMKEKGQGSL